jgi:glutaredoxin
VRVEVFYIDGCPNHKTVVERVKKVLKQERVSVEPIEIEIHDETEAKKMGFFGSPTIRVNGRDVDPRSRARTATGVACRYYTGGLPSEDMICAAVREAERK